ncbi:MAG: EF-P lysine aminoacylase EpmA [Planctomycetota bacterium]
MTAGVGSHEENAGSLETAQLIQNLRLRAQILQQTRAFLMDRGYWEVDTPTLSPDSVVDAHLDPFLVPIPPESTTSEPRHLYLQTSPEFAMKRLLAIGSGSIFQIAHAYRTGERGPLHCPEFTLVEWYRVGGNYQDLMTEVGELVRAIVGCSLPDRTTYRDAFLRHVGLDPLLDPVDRLASRCFELGWTGSESSRDELLNFLLATSVEPHLGRDRPTFLYDYPASQAALAVIDPGPPPVARRFELYVNGIELCNGYQELTDPSELLERNRKVNQIRHLMGKPILPLDSQLLGAMERGLPACAGVALGFDRLVMLAVNASSIDSVLPFPNDSRGREAT